MRQQSEKVCEGHKAKFYYPQLDGLRSLAFLIVFASHAGGVTAHALPMWIHPILNAYNHILYFGWAGVDLFFCLSAFLITSILLREEAARGDILLGRFLLRRVLRIWPLYYLAVLLGLLLFPFICTPTFVAFGTPGYWDFTRTSFLWLATFTANLGMSWLIMNVPMNLLPLWSVSMEEQFYLFWGIFLKYVKAIRWRFFFVVVLFATTVLVRKYLQQQYPETFVPYTLNTFARLDAILFGSAIAFAFHYWPASVATAKKFSSLLFLASLLFISLAARLPLPLFVPHHFRLFDATLVGFCCASILLVLLTFSPLERLFSLKPVAAFGRLTYGMYVFHEFVLQALNTWLLVPLHLNTQTNVPTLVNVGLGLPLTFGIAWAVWHIFEGRFYELKSKYATIQSGFMEADRKPRLLERAGATVTA